MPTNGIGEQYIHPKITEDQFLRMYPERAIIETGPTDKELLLSLIEKVDALDRKIDLIFGDHVLIMGRFKPIIFPISVRTD